MKNEQKAKELSTFASALALDKETAAYEVAKQIAEWKDFQFKYAIKDYIANCKKVGDYESASALEDFYEQFKTE